MSELPLLTSVVQTSLAMIIRVSNTSACMALCIRKTETDMHSDATGTGHPSDATLN
jgi:hypothetical protein